MKNIEINVLIERFIPLANSLASKKALTKPKNITYEELQSAAYLGLVDAASKHNLNQNFYPHKRICGEMNDYLRFLRWGSRDNPVLMRSLDFDA